jgi:2-polyprenyl-3-methyl-5-hydroxy-6-metoxy-1,4-benzoquinol methylase
MLFLVRSSPAYLGGTTRFLAAPHLTQPFSHLTDAVRNGGTAEGEGAIAPEHPMWVDFARGMAPMMAMPAEKIAKLVNADAGEKWKVLDIAAGHGMFGITLAKHNPNAQIVALDWPRVLEVARQNAEKAGITSRYSTIPGSAFEVDFGTAYDLVLLTNILHHFDVPTCELLLRKVHAALKPGGRAVTLDLSPRMTA